MAFVINDEIRSEMRKKPQIAVSMLCDELGVSESTFYRKLRHEIQTDERKEILQAIDRCRFVLKASGDEIQILSGKHGEDRIREIDRMRNRP